MIVKDIPIKEIKLGENIRQVIDSVEISSLMQTMKDNGLLQPIGVRETNDEYQIIWGNRRLSAAKKLGWKTISAVIYSSKEESMTEEEFVLINAIENVQQSPNTLYELGRICKILGKTMSKDNIAVRLGIPKSRVRNAFEEIGRIPLKWQKKIKIMEHPTQDKKGFIPVTTAMKITQHRGLSPKVKDKLLSYASKNDATFEGMEKIGSILRNNPKLSMEKAIKEANNYISLSFNIICDKKKLENLLEKYKTKTNLVISCINKCHPNTAINAV